MPVPEAEAAAMKRRHEAHVANLMGDALTLMMYQTEITHAASPERTALVVKIGEAREAARSLAAMLRRSEPVSAGRSEHP